MRGIAQIKNHMSELGSGNEKQKYAELKNMVLADKPVIANITGSNV